MTKAPKTKMTGMSYPAFDPLRFLVDDEIKTFFIDQRHDLTATAAAVSQPTQATPIKATGVFVVHQHKVPEKTAEVILGVAPHVWARQDPGGANETVVPLTPQQVMGWVLFTQSKTQNQPAVVEIDYNTPLASTATPNDANRQKLSGSTFVPTEPQGYSQLSAVNVLNGLYLPGGSLFEVYFQLMPQIAPASGGITKAMQIGAGNAPLRLDFAGAAVFGVRMPQQRYDALLAARRQGLLGPEAG